ncbi:MAG: Asp23/Gls24 family envelope stress response protein [Clostridia bacterium]|nr:Asp23/Gls24 family envelope stress response protein [Clostridia bacterium]
MAKKNNDQILPLQVESDDEPSSSITYANEVIAIIAGLAASEVEGVAGMVNVNTGLKGKNKNAAKGVKVEVGTEEVSVDLYLNVEYGTPIQRAAHDAQEGVKKSIESMTGLHVVRVDVHVQGVSFEKENNLLQAGAGNAVLEAGEQEELKPTPIIDQTIAGEEVASPMSVDATPAGEAEAASSPVEAVSQEAIDDEVVTAEE